MNPRPIVDNAPFIGDFLYMVPMLVSAAVFVMATAPAAWAFKRKDFGEQVIYNLILLAVTYFLPVIEVWWGCYNYVVGYNRLSPIVALPVPSLGTATKFHFIGGVVVIAIMMTLGRKSNRIEDSGDKSDLTSLRLS